MAFREKILVGVMIAAVAYGGYTLLDFEKSTHTGPAAPQDTQAKAMALSALEVATQSRLSGLEWYILETALDSKGRNPFQRLEAMVQEMEARPDNDARPVFVYGGFLETEGLRLALINGRAYAEGEYLKEPGYVLLQIREASVVVAHQLPSGVETWRREIVLTDGFF